MNMLIYIAACMAISFVVGLAMGAHAGYLAAWEAAERRMHQIVLDYAEQVRQLRMRERALLAAGGRLQAAGQKTPANSRQPAACSRSEATDGR